MGYDRHLLKINKLQAIKIRNMSYEELQKEYDGINDYGFGPTLLDIFTIVCFLGKNFPIDHIKSKEKFWTNQDTELQFYEEEMFVIEKQGFDELINDRQEHYWSENNTDFKKRLSQVVIDWKNETIILCGF